MSDAMRLSSLNRFRHPAIRFALPVLSIVALLVSFHMCWNKCSDRTTHGPTGHQDDNFYREDRPIGQDEIYEENTENLNPNDLGKGQGQHKSKPVDEVEEEEDGGRSQKMYKAIQCHINEDYNIPCRKEDKEVYVPFSFVQNYFEITGSVQQQEDGGEVLNWLHSYSEIKQLREKYSTKGVFMHFDHYNVEVRDRVKCVSGMDGIPVSTQWGPQGYYYPIQIAQFGLSHYSKFLIDTEKASVTQRLKDGQVNRELWEVPGGATVHSVEDDDRGGQVVEFKNTESFSKPGIFFSLDETADFVLTFDLKFEHNGSLTVEVMTKGRSKQKLFLTYTCSNVFIAASGNNIYHGIGANKCRMWRTFTRDIVTDVQKGAKILWKKKYTKKHISSIVGLHLRGHGWIDNISTSSSAHMAQFFAAADWMLKAQDEEGGWPIMVTRRIADGTVELPPGWYSAMAQGHAMSTLTRAFLRSKEQKYLDAAIRGLKPFDVKSKDHGVLAIFMDKYAWYEEYPTTPSLFVLNGFIYSLLGLYDLKSVAPENSDVQRLYSQGLTSLKAMLPLYDTGSGTTYDLRHVTMSRPPNRARWDYHTTHITQLLVLASIEDDPIFATMARRWTEYTKGKRSPHN
ncbi:D-glucuronyl C5-epimerase B-like [Lingula anatina]|uniref:heparosan-N-sulfate-glucuronate 5-epimerase n=1 Tax=Lingula anatina TaxID=7574 RepID=A0A1S3JHW0_LINAN|nr:D-glucuronyl C5-epimerase B-like [Lingula anatina]XP_013409954.1 D-glucuronyl C5-epimerase B-like [Lingula anatina]|eukprot:XP_013409953.1 D-glucuronyl C5-epimerase B-like [Lingula anatina]